MSQRYENREDNRRDCLRIVNGAAFVCCQALPARPARARGWLMRCAAAELVDEGAREGGGLDAAAPGAATVLARQARQAQQAAAGQAAAASA